MLLTTESGQTLLTEGGQNLTTEGGASLPQAATPAITPSAGTVPSGTQVTIGTTTDPATVRYTTDGATVTTASSVYDPAAKPTLAATGTTAQTRTVKARAFAAGLGDSDEASATYTVNPPAPNVTQHPANTAIQTGNTVSLAWSAGSAASVQAQRNDGSGWGNVPGATLSGYTTPTLTTANDGVQFRAAFSNAGGTTYSNPATITVTSAPVPTPTVSGILLRLGGQSVTSVTAPNPSGGTLDFDWTVDGTNNPPQTVNVTKQSGPGSLDAGGTGVLTYPARTNAAQTIVLRFASTFDPTKFANVTVTIPAAEVVNPNPNPGTGGGFQLVALPLSVQQQGALTLMQGDTAPARFVQLTDASGQPLELPDGTQVTYRLKSRTGDTTVTGPATVELGILGLVRYDWAAPIPAAGQYREQWQVAYPGGRVVHVPSDGSVNVTVAAPLT